MEIKVLVESGDVKKVATAVNSKDGANWKWEYLNKDIKKQCNIKAAWVYFIVKNEIVMKPGGTGMSLVNRANFYASANKWTDKAGYCNAATNPLIWHYLNNGEKIELYAVNNPMKAIKVNQIIMGKNIEFTTNPDFRPYEDEYRNIIKKYNITNNITDEDLLWDGKELQKTLNNLGLKEVNIKQNKRIPHGYKVINEQLVKV